MQKRKQILAMSNSSAFFVEPPDPPCLARYLVGLTGKERPVIVHVGAANGDSSEKVSKFCDLGRRAGFCPRHFNLFALENDDPDTFFAGADISEFGKPPQAPGYHDVFDIIESLYSVIFN